MESIARVLYTFHQSPKVGMSKGMVPLHGSQGSSDLTELATDSQAHLGKVTSTVIWS